MGPLRSPFNFNDPDWTRNTPNTPERNIWHAFLQQQQRFGPYTFAPDGGAGGSGPGLGQPTQGGPTPTGPVDIGLANMAQNAIQGTSLSQPNPGLFSGNLTGKGALSTAANVLGTLGATVMGIPAGPLGLLTSGLNAVTNAALKAGLVGQDTSGMVDQATAVANGFTSPSAMAAIAQGLGLNAAQLNAINQNATFGRGKGDDPDDPEGTPAGPVGPSATGPSAPGPAAVGESGGVGTTGATDGPPGGDTSGTPEDKGGYIGRKPRPKVDAKGHVRITALPTEFVVNPKATKLRRTLLEAINKGASNTELAGILKRGR